MQANTASAMPAHTPAAEPNDGAVPAFFRYHGVMAPGIRLFRVIGFAAKAAWVSAAFVVPMVFLAASLWTVASESIDFSSREMMGSRYARNILALVKAEQAQRRAATVSASDLPAMSEAVKVAMNAVVADDRLFGETLKTADAFRAVQGLHRTLSARPVSESPSATFAAHTALVAATMELLADVADNSNLMLDPDLDSFYLMSAAVQHQPTLVEQLGRLRGMGNAVLQNGSMTLDQRDTLSSALAFADASNHSLNKALRRARSADDQHMRHVAEDETLAATTRFLQAARQRLMGASLGGDAPAFLAEANRTIDANYALNGRILDALDEALEDRVSTMKRRLWMQVGIASAGVLLAIYLLAAFYRVTQGGIAEVARHLDEISSGNLTHSPRPWGRDEAARLMTTLAQTIGTLRRVVQSVRDSAGQIEVASDEIATASSDLSRRTEETAAHLQRTSSAMEQMNGTVRHTAETAAGATTLVERNAEVATQGGQIVAEVVSTMDGIRDSSTRIAEIISVIDAIAFQTNILALNAAVEAARAGEQGRGFAVVASEVRALAQRTAAAAREVKELIQSSVERVQNGSTVVGQAGSTMTDIVDNAARIKELMTGLSHAASEQSGGLADVSASVVRLDNTTQQNAALVEETAAAAAALRDSAARLNREVAYFRLS